MTDVEQQVASAPAEADQHQVSTTQTRPVTDDHRQHQRPT
jgi:hypothetical protein